MTYITIQQSSRQTQYIASCACEFAYEKDISGTSLLIRVFIYIAQTQTDHHQQFYGCVTSLQIVVRLP